MFLESVDYDALQTTVELSPEQNFQGCFNLSIINDDIFEVDEDFFINIDTTDVDTFINTPTIRVVIKDDDCKLRLLTCTLRGTPVTMDTVSSREANHI